MINDTQFHKKKCIININNSICIYFEVCLTCRIQYDGMGIAFNSFYYILRCTAAGVLV